MKLHFNEAKVTQSAAFLLKLRGGRMKYIKLLKLLYLADRKALIERGRPISTDRYVSMDNGPVLSVTFNLIQGNYRSSDRSWSTAIVETDDHDVMLRDTGVDQLDLDELSRADLKDLESVFNEYGHWNRWRLIDEVMHKLPEWQDPNGSMIPIQYRDILQGSGLSAMEQSAIENELESLSAVQDLLAAHSE